MTIEQGKNLLNFDDLITNISKDMVDIKELKTDINAKNKLYLMEKIKKDIYERSTMKVVNDFLKEDKTQKYLNTMINQVKENDHSKRINKFYTLKKIFLRHMSAPFFVLFISLFLKLGVIGSEINVIIIGAILINIYSLYTFNKYKSSMLDFANKQKLELFREYGVDKYKEEKEFYNTVKTEREWINKCILKEIIDKKKDFFYSNDVQSDMKEVLNKAYVLAKKVEEEQKNIEIIELIIKDINKNEL